MEDRLFLFIVTCDVVTHFEAWYHLDQSISLNTVTQIHENANTLQNLLCHNSSSISGLSLSSFFCPRFLRASIFSPMQTHHQNSGPSWTMLLHCKVDVGQIWSHLFQPPPVTWEQQHATQYSPTLLHISVTFHGMMWLDISQSFSNRIRVKALKINSSSQWITKQMLRQKLGSQHTDWGKPGQKGVRFKQV